MNSYDVDTMGTWVGSSSRRTPRWVGIVAWWWLEFWIVQRYLRKTICEYLLGCCRKSCVHHRTRGLRGRWQW